MWDQRRNARESIWIKWQRDLFFRKCKIFIVEVAARKRSLRRSSIVRFQSFYVISMLFLHLSSFFFHENIINRYLNEILIKKAFVSNVPVSDFFPNRKKLEKLLDHLSFTLIMSQSSRHVCNSLNFYDLSFEFPALMNQIYLRVLWFATHDFCEEKEKW